MIFADGKTFLRCTMLTATLWHGVLGSNHDISHSDSWVNGARRLDTKQFMDICDDVLISPQRMQQQIYHMSDFADEVTDLCLRLAPNPDQGTCRKSEFRSLDVRLQKAFFSEAGKHSGHKPFPMEVIASMGDAGYVISDNTKSTIQQASMRIALCSEVHKSIGEEFLEYIPSSNESVVNKPVNKNPVFNNPVRTTKSEDGILSQIPKQTDLNAGESTIGNNNDQPFSIVEIKKEEGILSIGAIIAISCAVAALIVLFFYFEARRRKQARNSRSAIGNKRFGGDGMRVASYSGGRNNPVEEVKAAINNADWDNVYKFASQIAESDDGLSLPDVDFKGQNRSHLSAEDQERTKTLDELATTGDWTGVAVTAALYAGETCGASTITYGADESSSRRETNFSRTQDVEKGHLSMEQMVTGLSTALNAGDWSEVSQYANLIKEQKNAGFDDSQVILTDPGFLSSGSSVSSTDTSNTEVSKKQTIEKLMRAGKWKGVSIMANMYEMESKQSSHSTSMRPYPPSPSHPYSGRGQDP